MGELGDALHEYTNFIVMHMFQEIGIDDWEAEIMRLHHEGTQDELQSFVDLLMDITEKAEKEALDGGWMEWLAGPDIDYEPEPRSDYDVYLASPSWKAKRKEVIDREKEAQNLPTPLCQRCRKNVGKQVHHLTYKNLYNEHLEDLELICGGCHKKAHGISDLPDSQTH